MKKILIVDDIPENLYLMRALLTGHGFEVDEARHGAEALVKARQSPPQLIISDLLMPVMDGFTLLHQWKADGRLKQIPFVVYTATYTEPQDEQLARNLGADGFIIKPAEPEEFLRQVREIIDHLARRPVADSMPAGTPIQTPGEAEPGFLLRYNAVLVGKLEKKLQQLENTRRELEQDIAARQQAEKHIKRLNRVYSVLSDTNQTIVREKDPQAMLETVCRIAVSKGLFRMAWVGRLDPATQDLTPVAFCGVVEGYLELAKINSRATSRNTGPAGRCLLSGEHAVCNDIENDPTFSPWRDEALRRGYRSVGCFPLKMEGQVAGAFILYAGEPDFFVAEELDLLDELAMDIGFALEVGKREEGRRKTEAELRWRTAFFEAQAESALDGILAVDAQGKKILQNQRMNDLWRIPPDIVENDEDAVQVQFVASKVKYPEKFTDRIAYLVSHPEVNSRDEVELVDGRILDRTSFPVRDKKGNYYGRIWTFRDITARRQVEKYREMGRKILPILYESGDLQSSVHRVLAILKADTGSDAVGIRLRAGEDFPYFAQEGFPKNFLLTENSLIERGADGEICRGSDGSPCLECTCGLVISGRTDPTDPLFTAGGSFWTNDAPTLLDIPADRDPRLHPRNQCIHFGYASMALVPIRTRDQIVGLLQLNDRRKDRFTIETIELLEGIATHIGEALIRKEAEIHLQEALIRAEAGSQAKSDFLGIMSHELRTPLNGVLGSAELLTFTAIDEEQRALVETVTSCGEHLLAIVQDILDFSSLEAGKQAIHAAPMAVAELIEQSVLTVQISAAAKGLAFRCETSPDVPRQITADALRIRQILINLLGNAVKFTAKGSVTLRVQPVAGGRSLDFSVEDTGIGISPETIGLLFKPFTQVDSTFSRSFGGTGLGLAISKRLAEAMGGSITVTSASGKGSTFTFHLPLESAPDSSGRITTPPVPDEEREPAKPHPPGQGDGKPPENKLVLVVEDDPGNATLAVKMLQSLGFRAEVATDGTGAVEAFAPGKYFAILMDVVMPMMNGMQATGKIRELESGSRVPIIALTANVMPGNRDQYIAAGMDDFLSKPFKRAELAAKLAGLERR